MDAGPGLARPGKPPIPGTVGAAPIQNIGAYGLEVGERIAWWMPYDFATRCLVAFGPEDFRFDYRDSIFKQEGWHLFRPASPSSR